MEKEIEHLSKNEFEKKKKEDKILSWFMTGTTIMAIIIAVYLMKNRPPEGWGNKNRDSDSSVIEISCDDCKKKIIELTKTNDSLRNVILLNKKSH